jgi:hypothetical protein
MFHREFLSCAAPPLLGRLHVSQGEFELLSVTDPIVIKRELLTRYTRHYNDLVQLLDPARRITSDFTDTEPRTLEFCLKMEGRAHLFADSLQKVERRIRFTCYLYQRLPEDTLD